MKRKIILFWCLILIFTLFPQDSTMAATFTNAEKSIKLAETDAAVLKSQVDINVRKKKYPKSPFSLINKNLISKALNSSSKAEKIVKTLPNGKQKSALVTRIDKNVKFHIKNAELFNSIITDGDKYKKYVEQYIESYMLKGKDNQLTIDYLKKAVQVEGKLNTIISKFPIPITKNALTSYYSFETIMKNELPKYQNEDPQVGLQPTGEILLFAQDNKNTYLGKLTTDTYDSESIFNEYGTYGSKYSTNSIWNEYGNFGSKYSTYSAFNPYTSTPPMIVQDGEIIGYLTVNKYVTNAISPYDIYDILVELGY
jgi:hypothetical protein